MQADKAADQREAESEAAARTVQRRRHLRELLEQSRQERRGDADAGIAHFQLDARALDRAVTSMRPPGGVYLQAFSSRLATTWVSRVGSPTTITGSAGR